MLRDLSALMSENPFAVFSFLVAPAILTNASTLISLSTSNRLARSVDRSRQIAATLLIDPSSDGQKPGVASTITRQLAQEQFHPSALRSRMLIRALRGAYCAIGSFAAGTLVAMFGAAMHFFGFPDLAVYGMVGMLVLCAVGVGALIIAAVFLIGETTKTIDLLTAEEREIQCVIDQKSTRK